MTYKIKCTVETFYAIRNKKNHSQYYRAKRKCVSGGWVDKLKRASVWGSRTGPCQIIKMLGDEYAEIHHISVFPQNGIEQSVYLIRHRVTGQYVSNRNKRVQGNFYCNRWDDAGIWPKIHHAKATIRAWEKYTVFKHLNIKREELEILVLPVFVPPVEVI